MTFVERLQARMAAKRWTQSHLVVALSDLGVVVHEMTVYRWLTGARQPRFEYIPALATALDVSTDWLLGREGAPEPKDFAAQPTGTEG